jgi:hypothetical protein
MISGVRGDYYWLEIDVPLEDLLGQNPHIVEGRYLAITMADCYKDRDVWREEGGIIYTSPIAAISDLRGLWFGEGCGELYQRNEGYVFDGPVVLSALSNENPFETPIEPERVFPFVGYLGFSLSDDSMKDVADLFWLQLEWIQPMAFIGACEGRSFLVTGLPAHHPAVDDAQPENNEGRDDGDRAGAALP